MLNVSMGGKHMSSDSIPFHYTPRVYSAPARLDWSDSSLAPRNGRKFKAGTNRKKDWTRVSAVISRASRVPSEVSARSRVVNSQSSRVSQHNQSRTGSQGREMSTQQMFECLLQHGCHDLTPFIDESKTSSGLVAGGSFGDIWKGCLDDGTDIAIKVWRFTSLPEDGNKSLKRAMRELYNWSKMDHENVHRLLGVAVFQGRLGMVSKWMENGNLREYIYRSPDVDRYELCVQVARGVQYLHRRNVVHGDLKACNILVSGDGVLTLTDFDHSIISDCSLLFSETTRIGGGTLRWMAPELVIKESNQRNQRTDIYALGMTLLEIMSGAVPYHPQCSNDAQVINKLTQKEIPKRTEHFRDGRDDQLWELLVECWNHDPAARPTANDVVASLENLFHGVASAEGRLDNGCFPIPWRIPGLKAFTRLLRALGRFGQRSSQSLL